MINTMFGMNSSFYINAKAKELKKTEQLISWITVQLNNSRTKLKEIKPKMK